MGPLISAWAPNREGRSHQMLMQVNILYLCFNSDRITTVQASYRQLSLIILHQMLSFGRIYNRSCSVPPTIPVHFTNLEVQERYLPVIRGVGTPLPCVPRHFYHWLYVDLQLAGEGTAPSTPLPN